MLLRVPDVVPVTSVHAVGRGNVCRLPFNQRLRGAVLKDLDRERFIAILIPVCLEHGIVVCSPSQSCKVLCNPLPQRFAAPDVFSFRAPFRISNAVDACAASTLWDQHSEVLLVKELQKLGFIDLLSAIRTRS